MKNIGLASEKLYRNALKPTYLRNRSILRIFQPGYRLVRMNLHTLLQRYRSELYQGILRLLHKLGFLEKWCIGLHHWTDKSCTGLDQPLLRQKFKSWVENIRCWVWNLTRWLAKWGEWVSNAKLGISFKSRALVQVSKLIKRSSI